MKHFLKACFLSLACSFCASVCLAETELVSMFREGLATSKDNPDKGAAMVETAVLQCTSDPMHFADIWEVYKNSDNLKSAENTTKIAMLDVFMECAQKTCQNCKTRSEFNKTWTVQLDIRDLRAQTINDECSIIRKILENLEMTSLLEHREELEILLEYADESDETNAGFLRNLSEKIANRTAIYETSYQKLKGSCNDVDWDKFSDQLAKGPFKSIVGETTHLIMDIQDYLLFLQTPEISMLLERFPPAENPLEQGEKLLEKAQNLNRVRYNLWANWVLYNFGDNVAAADALPLISPEFLYTPVEILFQEKQEALFNKTRNAAALSDILQRLILEEKVPLTAF